MSVSHGWIPEKIEVSNQFGLTMEMKKDLVTATPKGIPLSRIQESMCWDHLLKIDDSKIYKRIH